LIEYKIYDEIKEQIISETTEIENKLNLYFQDKKLTLLMKEIFIKIKNF